MSEMQQRKAIGGATAIEKWSWRLRCGGRLGGQGIYFVEVLWRISDDF